MRQWLAFLVCAALLACGSTENASATSTNNNVANASQWCFELESGGSGAIIQPLVECFTDQSSGIIPMVTTTFLANAKADYLPTIGVIFLLAIAVFGLKMAGIMLFLDNAPAFYIDLLNIMQLERQALITIRPRGVRPLSESPSSPQVGSHPCQRKTVAFSSSCM